MRDNLMQRRELLTTAALAPLLAPVQITAAHELDKPARRFQLGTVTYNIAANWDLPTLLRVCKNVGLKAVELRTTHKHGVETSLSPMQRAEVRKQVADSGVVLWGLGTVCEFHSTDASVVAQHVETCKAFLQLAADTGARGVKVRPNGLPRHVPIEKTVQQIGKALAVCGKAATDLGQEIWVEVHGAGTAHPPHMKTIMEACGHPSVGITWNSNLRSDLIEGAVKPGLDMLKPWIKSCHINELFNEYPYRELFAFLTSAGYDRYTLIEIPQKLDPAAGELLLRYYRKLWDELSAT